MPNFQNIAKVFGKISDSIRVGGTFGLVYGDYAYNGFPTTLGERKMAALQGSGNDYQFSVVLPQVEIDGSNGKAAWQPQNDQMVEGSGVKYRIAAVSWHSTQTIVHLAKWLD